MPGCHTLPKHTRAHGIPYRQFAKLRFRSGDLKLPFARAFDSNDLPRAAGFLGAIAALTLAAALTLSSPATAAPDGAGNLDAARLAGRGLGAAELVYRRPRPRTAPTILRWRKSTPRTSSSWVLPGATTLGDPMRGQEATPIVIDGVMYTSGTWGYVYAVDAASGKQLWRYDPKADYFTGRNPCCDLVNRGVVGLEGQGLCGLGRWPAACAGRRDRPEAVGSRHHHRSQATVLEHRRSADRGRRRGHRQQRRRHGSWRRARLRVGVRLGQRRAQVALLHGSTRGRTTLRKPGTGRRGQDLGSASQAAVQGRRDGMGWIRLRCEVEPGVLRHGQCGSL